MLVAMESLGQADDVPVELLGKGLLRKTLDDPLPPRLTHPLLEPWLSDKLLHGRREALWGRRTEESGFAMSDRLQRASRVDADDRAAAIHGLHRHNAKVFVGGRVEHADTPPQQAHLLCVGEGAHEGQVSLHP